MSARSLAVSLGLELGAGALAAAVIQLVVSEASTRASALLGVAVALGAGLLILLLKLSVPRVLSGGRPISEVRALLAMTGLSFGLRLVTVLVGAVALHQRGLSPTGFVLAFFCIYLAQQVLETRAVISGRAQPARGVSQ